MMSGAPVDPFGVTFLKRPLTEEEAEVARLAGVSVNPAAVRSYILYRLAQSGELPVPPLKGNQAAAEQEYQRCLALGHDHTMARSLKCLVNRVRPLIIALYEAANPRLDGVQGTLGNPTTEALA